MGDIVFPDGKTVMADPVPETLIAWLDDHLRDKNWTDNQLAIAANISPSVISKARKGGQNIGWEACLAIARALDAHPLSILTAAGHLPDLGAYGTNVTFEDWKFVLSQLPERDQQELLDFARLKLKRQQEEEDRRLRNSRPRTAEG